MDSGTINTSPILGTSNVSYVTLAPVADIKAGKAMCPSTHGGSGYAPGSYKDGDTVICGICGARIENPTPVGYSIKYKPKKNRNWIQKFFGLGYERYKEPRFPEWME